MLARAHVSTAEPLPTFGGRLGYVVRAAPQEHLEWGVNHIGCVPTADMRGIECVDSSGRILGMILYTGWMLNSVQMHVALAAPIAAKSLLRPAFEYPFVQCGLGVVVGLVAEVNKRALRLDRHLGFTELARVRDGWARGKDLIVFEMRKENCRFLTEAERKAA